MTKIDLITGILGSGKTTFLKHYARYLISQGQRIAILENDFGAVNVDMMILQDLKCDNCQLEMVAGGGDAHCHRRRFKTQLISLGMQHFDRVIVEPSGIFDMDEFFDTIHESPLDRWFEVGSILTIIDAETDEQLPEQMEYLFASEAACCGKLILSKRESFPDETEEQTADRLLAHLERSLAEIRCDRHFSRKDILAKNWNELTDNDFSTLLNAGYRGSSYVKKYHPGDIISGVHYFMNIAMPYEKIADTVENIILSGSYGRIMRIKGSLPDGNGGWIKINATREKTELSPVTSGQAVLIVIGDDINKEGIDEVFRRVNTDPEYISI
ncbi:MAG: GTP-binding protein [Ruminococcus sp.]|nr:GTP-binding protein [Ruminococcus sp.]